MEVEVLGTVGARDDADRPLKLGGAQQTRLLAALVVAAGQPVESHRLVEVLWSGAPPEGARGALQTYVSRLRRELGNAAIRSSDIGYSLDTDVIGVDSIRFERAVSHARAQDPAEAVDLLTGALEQWRGPAFGSFADEWWARPSATRLEELRLSARELRVRALLSLDRAAEALAETESLLAMDPLRESSAVHRMLALHLVGRSADALRVGSAFRRRLGEHAGLDASPELAALERQILDHDPAVGAALHRAARGYQFGNLLAQGTHGAVYAAMQPLLGREVAIKTIRADRADEPDFVRRFEAEAQLLARLEHPGIVPLYDYWREPGAAYLVFRLLRGGSLQDRLARGDPVTLDDLDLLVDRVGGALAVAHRSGVVHRDIRPANVLFDDDGLPYLGDFGIAVAADDENLVDDIAALAALVAQVYPAAGDTAENALRSVLRRAAAGELATVADFVTEWRLARGASRSTSPSPSPSSPGRPGRRRSIAAGDNPYKGLRPFTEADQADFFGRAKVIEELGRMVDAHPYVTVVGPSGSGKSSVVHAGLLPMLREAGYLTATMTPGVRPLWALGVALRRVATQAQDDACATTEDLLVELAEAAPLVLVVDQLEELWTRSVEEDRMSFVAALGTALDCAGSHLRVVSTIRADFFDRPLADAGIGPRTRIATFPLVPMEAADLEAAIVGPLLRSAVTIEPGLVARLVNDVAARPGALPLLQFALATLFDERTAQQLTHEVYDRFGGVSGVVASAAEEQFLQLTPALQEQVRHLFGSLVVPGDGSEHTRRRATLSELSDVPPILLDELSASRLVTFDRDPASGEPTVEIAHEALLAHWPRLVTWLAADSDELRFRRMVRDAAHAWTESERDPSHLFRGTRLLGVQGLERDRMGPDEQAFLAASEQERDRELVGERRRLRRTQMLLGATAVLLVGAFVAGLLALQQRGEARDRATEARRSATQAEANARQADAASGAAEVARIDAELRRLASESGTIAPGQPDLGLLLAAEVAQRRPGVESESALLTALQANPFIDRVIDLGLPDEARITSIAGQIPGPLVAVSAATAVVLDGASLEPSGVTWGLDARANVAVNPAGTEAATASGSGRVERRRTGDGAPAGPTITVAPGQFYGGGIPVAYLGDRLVVANGSWIEIYDSGAAEPIDRLLFDHTVAFVAATPDGTQLVVSEAAEERDADTFVIDVASGGRRALGGWASAVAFSSDGTAIYLAGAGFTVRRLGRDTLAVTGSITPSPVLGYRLIVLDTGDLVAESGTLELSRVAGDLSSAELVDNVAPLSVELPLADGRVLAGVGAQVAVVDPHGSSPVVTELAIQGAVEAAADGARLLVSGPDGARLLDATTFAPLGPLLPSLANAAGRSWGLSPDGDLVAGTEGASLVVRSTLTGDAVSPTLPPGSLPTFAPDGTVLAVAIPTGLALYDATTFALVRQIEIRGQFPLDIQWSPDGTALVLTDITSGGHLVNVADGTVTRLLGQFASYAVEGTTLATIELGEPLRLIDQPTGEVTPLTGFRELGYPRFLPGGHRLLRALAAGYWDLLDVATGSRIGTPFIAPFGAQPFLTEIAIIADGSAALAGLAGQPVVRLELDPRRWAELACAAAGRNLTRAEWDRFFGDIAPYDVTCPQYPPG